MKLDLVLALEKTMYFVGFYSFSLYIFWGWVENKEYTSNVNRSKNVSI